MAGRCVNGKAVLVENLAVRVIFGRAPTFRGSGCAAAFLLAG